MSQIQPVRFFTRIDNYQILVRPTSYEVKNNVTLLIHGETILFEDGEFVTDNKKTVEFLRAHKRYGLDFQEDKTPANADANIYAKAEGR